MKYDISSNLDVISFENFCLETLWIESSALKKNPLKDSHKKANPILVPKQEAPRGGWPVVFLLSGLGGNGPKSFGLKHLEDNTPQAIDRAVSKKVAPLALYVFVDAMTFWGGSQFVNSAGCGRYEDYVMCELVEAIRLKYQVSDLAKKWCVTGASSGGYGALHLGSLYPETFGVMAALAPDSDFEKSLLPEIYETASTLLDIGVSGVRRELLAGKLYRRKNGFALQNAVAMAHCYSEDKKVDKKSFPLDLKTGEPNSRTWKKYFSKDPVIFLPQRKKNLRKLHRIYLDVGEFDQFHLFFGTRKMTKFLKSQKIHVHSTEFRGNHFDMAPRRLVLWDWLEKLWKTQS